VFKGINNVRKGMIVDLVIIMWKCCIENPNIKLSSVINILMILRNVNMESIVHLHTQLKN